MNRTPPSSQHPSDNEADQDDDQIVVNKKVSRAAGAKPKKQTNAKNARTKKANAKTDEVEAAINTVKSRNKLVGDMMNNELYASDDEQAESNVVFHEDEANKELQELDLGMGDRANAPKK